VLFGLFETARDPVSLDFLDAMRHEQPSPFQSQAGYVFMQVLGNLPVAAIRAYLSDPEKAARVDMNGLCLMVDDRNIDSRARKRAGHEDKEEVYGFLLERLCELKDTNRLLSLDRRLSGRYPGTGGMGTGDAISVRQPASLPSALPPRHRRKRASRWGRRCTAADRSPAATRFRRYGAAHADRAVP